MAVNKTRLAARLGADVRFFRPRRVLPRRISVDGKPIQPNDDENAVQQNDDEEEPVGKPSGGKPSGGKPSSGKPSGGKPSFGKPSGGTPSSGVNSELTDSDHGELDQQNDDDDDTVRLEAEATDECTYNDTEGASLKIQMRVFHKNRPAFRSLIGYYVSVFLRPKGSNDWEDIGSITAYGISRPTAQHPNINPGLWQTEWLQDSLDESKYASGTECIAKALRSIYSRNGNVRARIDQNFRGQLTNDGTGDALVYIAQLYIKQQNATTGVFVSSLTLIVWDVE